MRNPHNRQPRSTRNRLRFGSVAGLWLVRQPDFKTLITPKGQTLTLHIPRNVKVGRGFHHERTGALLCPAGYEWANKEYVVGFILYLLTKGITRSRTKVKLRNGQLQVAGDLWPIFLYAGYSYDAEDPWNGLLRSTVLVLVSLIYTFCFETS